MADKIRVLLTEEEVNRKRKEQNTLTYITYIEIKIQEEKK